MKRLLSLILVVCLSFVVNNGFAQFQSKPLGNSSPATKPVTKPATTTTTVAAGPATTTTATAVATTTTTSPLLASMNLS